MNSQKHVFPVAILLTAFNYKDVAINCQAGTSFATVKRHPQFRIQKNPMYIMATGCSGCNDVRRII
jgi:hypothetical protein